MDKIIWKEAFCSGIQFIDEQHQVIVAKLNELIDAYHSTDDAGDTEWLLLNFLKECQHHYQGEYTILAQQGYAKLETFARGQVEFNERVERLHRLTLLSNNVIPVSLILFLRSWVATHLNGEEMMHLHSLMLDS